MIGPGRDGAGRACAEPFARPAPPPRPTLIDLYILRLLTVRTAVILGLIFTVMMLERSLRLAVQMAGVGAHMRFLPAMIWNLGPHYVALALPAAFMLAMLTVVSRLDEDLEIEAMLASGFSLWRIVGGLAAVGAGVAAASLLFSGFLEPQGLYRFRSLRGEAVRAGWTAEAQPWAFQGRSGSVVLTADATDAGGRVLTRLFIVRHSQRGLETVMTAPQGRLGLAPDRRTATLSVASGRVYLERAKGPPLVGAFTSYSLLDPYASSLRTPPRGDRPEELTLPELAARSRQTPARAELCARLARAASIPLLPFLALPMAVASRKGRRALGMALAAGLTLLIHEALRLAQSLGVSGQAEPVAATAGVLAAALALTAWIYLANRRLHGDTPLASALQRLQALLGAQATRPPPNPRVRASVAGYIRREVGLSVLGALAAMVGVLVMIDLFERTSDILDRGLGYGALVRYAAFRTPILAQQMIGLATLIGASFAFLRLSRSSEIVAARTVGVSLYQVAGMCLPVCVAIAAFSVALAEGVSPAAHLGLARLWASAPAEQGQSEPSQWFRLGSELVSARSASPDGAILSGVVIYRRGAEGELAGRTAARRAIYDSGGWRLEGASGVGIGDAGVTRLPAPATWPTHMAPRDVAQLFARPQQISAADALRSLDGAAPTSQSRGFLLTRAHRALAEPIAPFVMLILALPLALSSPRTGPRAATIIAIWGLGLLYAVVDGVGTACGQTGMAPPVLAAWLAPALFLPVAATALVVKEA